MTELTPGLTGYQIGQRARRTREITAAGGLSQRVETKALRTVRAYVKAQVPAIVDEASEVVAKTILERFQQKRDAALRDLLKMYTQDRISPVKLLKKNLLTLATEVVNLRVAADGLLAKSPKSAKAFYLYRGFLSEHRKLLREMREVMMQLHKLQKEKRAGKTAKEDGTLEDILGQGGGL